MECKLITSQKGTRKLCLDGFMYVIKHNGKKEITWRCEKSSSLKCGAKIKTDLDMNNQSTVSGIHNHAGCEERVAAAEARLQMKRLAETTLDKPNQILSAVSSQLPDEVNAMLPSEDVCRRTIRNVRSKKRPRDPKSLDDLEISDAWKLTTGSNPQLFLQHDNGKESEERLLIFSTDELLEHLGRSTSWFMDGTFDVAPSLFNQLYVIHGQIGTDRCPLLYALMQRQSQSSYEDLFNFILSKCNADPGIITVDFEKGVHQAIRNVLGNDVTIQGCFYHLTQSTWRKIASLGLVQMYKADEEFRLFCGKLDGLAFLPVDQVKDGMSYLRSCIPPGAEELIDYFDNTYVSGALRKCQLQGRRLGFKLRRMQPNFAPDTWNCHEVTVNNTSRTNNVCEGWNNGFKCLVGQSHPSIWKLIENLQKEEARVHTRILKDARGIINPKRKRRIYEELQKRLYNLCIDLNSGRKDIPQFLLGISHNIRFGQPNI